MLISEKYIGSTCEVRDEYGDLLATGIITQVASQFVKIVYAKDIISTVSKGIQAIVNIVNADLKIKAITGRVFLVAKTFLMLVDVEILSAPERRAFFRIKVNMQTMVEYEGFPFDVQILNISMGGILFSCSKELVIGDVVIIYLTLERGIFLFRSVIRRKISAEDASFHYGCEFVNNVERSLDSLCSYIFKMEKSQPR